MIEYTVEFKEEDIITCCATCRFCQYGDWTGDATCLINFRTLEDVELMPITCPLKFRED